MDTMKQLAVIAQGNADYVDRLRELLEATDIDPEEFTGLEYFGLTPFFVMAGATVRPQAHTHGDDIHVEAVVVELADDLRRLRRRRAGVAPAARSEPRLRRRRVQDDEHAQGPEAPL
jgi:hypothetical protein